MSERACSGEGLLRSGDIGTSVLAFESLAFVPGFQSLLCCSLAWGPQTCLWVPSVRAGGQSPGAQRAGPRGVLG